MTAAPLLPRKALFDNPDRRTARISPDGRWLSWLAPDEGVLNVFVAPAGDPASARPLTRDRGRGVPEYQWAYTGRHVLHVQDAGGDENWQVLATDVETGRTHELTPCGSRAQIAALSPLMPGHVLLIVNDRDPQLMDPCLVDLATGERSRTLNDLGLAGFAADLRLRVRLGIRVTPDGGREVLELGDDGTWRPDMLIGLEDAETTSPLGYDVHGALYLVDSRGRDTAAFVRRDPVTRQTEVLCESHEADAGEVLLHPRDATPQAVSFERQRLKWVALDASVGADIALLAERLRGDVHVVSRTLDDRRWIVAETRDDGPVRYFTHDREARDTRLLFASRDALEGVRLARMHPVSIRSRDGLELVSFLSLPPGSDRGGRPEAPLPAVLLVHGGPWHRDHWGMDPFHQLFADRGLAVLSVNFRGSTGFGKSFLNKGNGEWGGRMQDDLEDAVAWMAREGVADPARVAIMGGSYGGYATLVGMTRTPELFACGVDIVGVSNLLTFVASIPPYWRPILKMWTSRVADPDTPDGHRMLVERSPLTRADAIRRPLLIAQGANDPRVKQAESDQIVAAMKRHGIPVTYCLFDDEGHGFRRPENNLAFIAVAEAFLARHLGCRSAPLEPSDLAGSSMRVLEGAEGVPGLAGALAAPR